MPKNVLCQTHLFELKGRILKKENTCHKKTEQNEVN